MYKAYDLIERLRKSIIGFMIQRTKVVQYINKDNDLY